MNHIKRQERKRKGRNGLHGRSAIVTGGAGGLGQRRSGIDRSRGPDRGARRERRSGGDGDRRYRLVGAPGRRERARRGDRRDAPFSAATWTWRAVDRGQRGRRRNRGRARSGATSGPNASMRSDRSSRANLVVRPTSPPGRGRDGRQLPGRGRRTRRRWCTRRRSPCSKARSARWPTRAAKGDIVGMTLPMARDFGTVGIRRPSRSPRGRSDALDDDCWGDRLESFVSQVAGPGRLGRPEEYAMLVGHIIVLYLNGTVIRLDAGTFGTQVVPAAPCAYRPRPPCISQLDRLGVEDPAMSNTPRRQQGGGSVPSTWSGPGFVPRLDAEPDHELELSLVARAAMPRAGATRGDPGVGTGARTGARRRHRFRTFIGARFAYTCPAGGTPGQHLGHRHLHGRQLNLHRRGTRRRDPARRRAATSRSRCATAAVVHRNPRVTA